MLAQETAKLNVKVVECCQINLNPSIRNCVGQMSNEMDQGGLVGK